MLVQRNGIAKIFGQTTMGLGGNVDERAINLPFSQATVDITRGLYTTYRPDGHYQTSDLIENNGVVPDIPYSHTLSDFRAGYVDYVKAFSLAALAQIPQSAPAAQPLPDDLAPPHSNQSTFSSASQAASQPSRSSASSSLTAAQ
jgi:C-terminal processing protease CtpA/Prc